jgi:hypothetical protein
MNRRADGTKCHSDGTKCHSDGTKCHSDGTKCHSDGMEAPRRRYEAPRRRYVSQRRARARPAGDSGHRSDHQRARAPALPGGPAFRTCDPEHGFVPPRGSIHSPDSELF